MSPFFLTIDEFCQASGAAIDYFPRYCPSLAHNLHVMIKPW
jgi:hypothetical protein